MATKTKIIIGTLIVINILIFGSLIWWIIIPPRGGQPLARTIADMHQMKIKAEMIYEKEKSYTSFDCGYDEDTKMLCGVIERRVGLKPTIHRSEKEYCAYIKLSPEEYFCIDSTGFAEITTINPGQKNYCDGITFVCKKEEVRDETADWKTYRNEEYGFEVKYPEDWEYGTDKEQPNILWLGHPLSGKQTFSLIIIVYDNSDKLTSKQWVEKLLQENREKVEKKEAAPLIYQEEKELAIAGLPAYELYGVFVYDQSEEQIYLTKENFVYLFRFPIAEENLNLFNPIENNRIAHQMLSTFKFLE